MNVCDRCLGAQCDTYNIKSIENDVLMTIIVALSLPFLQNMPQHFSHISAMKGFRSVSPK